MQVLNFNKPTKAKATEHHKKAEAVAVLMRSGGDPLKVQVVWSIFTVNATIKELSGRFGVKESIIRLKIRSLRLDGVVFGRRIGADTYYGLTEKGYRLAEAIRVVGQ